MGECWGVAAGQLCSEYKCWTFGAVQKQRWRRLRRQEVEEVVPRDEGEVRKHFGQSFLWNVTKSRALWKGDDDAGIFPTASLKRKDSMYNKHTRTNKEVPKMSSNRLLRTHLRGKPPASLYSLPLPSCSGRW